MTKFKFAAALALLVMPLTVSCSKKPQPERADIKIVSTKTAEQAAAEAPPAPRAAGSISMEINAGGNHSVTLSSVSDSSWTLTGKNGTLSLSGSGAGYELTKDNSPIADGKMDGDKLKLKSPDGSVYLAIKFKADKYKVADAEGDGRWEIKLKTDKLKVYSDGAESGGVKYKTDTGKLKAKDPNENEIAVSRNAGRLSAVAAPYLMTGLDAGRQDALALVLYALGK